MKDVLTVCAYCERTAEEVVAATVAARLAPIPDDERAELERTALLHVRVGDNRVLLCPDDRGDLQPLSEQEMWELIYAPVDLPPGVTVLRHHCPMLEYDGFSEEEATSQVELVEDDDHPGYLVGHCSECGMTVRSRVVQSNHEETE